MELLFSYYLLSSRFEYRYDLTVNSNTMGKIPGSAHLNLSLGGLVMIGGAMGYLKKGSKMSLIAGLTTGSLLLGSGYLIGFSDDKQYEGHLLATATSGLLAAGMGQRFLATQKVMPAGLVAAVGVIACAYNFQKSREWAPDTKSA